MYIPDVTMKFAGVTMALGDVIAQLCVERKRSIEFSRTGRFLLYGLFITVRIVTCYFVTFILEIHYTYVSLCYLLEHKMLLQGRTIT